MTSPDPLRVRLAAALGERYTLERELSGGGMARVFVAHEAALHRRVVIKTLAPELAATLSAERFDREIQLVAALQHPHIVGVLTSGAVDGVPWFAMPYVEGDSLRARLVRGPLTEAQAVPLLRDVARALAYAHDRGIVHRDIKPDNILLSDDAAVVTDFGIAKAVTAARTQADARPAPDAAITSVGMSLGTPAYMAPEQAAADADIDRRADLYALGCVAYELVAGHPPFTAPSAAALLRAHLLTPPPPLPAAAKVSHGYAALVARCLAKDPDGRPASAREVLRALEPLGAAGEGATARGGLMPALAAWAATLGATYVLARAAVVGIGLPDFTVAWATGAAALGLPALLATWWIQRTARRAQLATPTWTPGGTLTQTTLAGLAVKASPHATWRRARRVALGAVGGVALLVTGVMGLRQFGLGPAASLAASGRVQGTPSLLLANFSGGGADGALGESLTQAMRIAMERSSAVRLVSPSAAGLALQRMARDPATPLSPAVAREIAKRGGIPLVLTGQVANAGNGLGLMVTVTLEAAASGEVLVTELRGARDTESLLDAIDWLARRVRARVGESLRDVNRTPPLAQVTTASLPALQAYSRAATLGDVQGRFAEAIVVLEEAVRADSTFASAWRKAGTYAWNLGRPRSEVLRYAREAYRHRERVPPDEREEIEAYLLRETRTKAGAEAYVRIAQAGGQVSGAGLVLRHLGRNALAESLLTARLRADSAAGRTSQYQVYLNLSGAQLGLGKVAEAQRTVAILDRFAPGAYWTSFAGALATWRVGGADSLAAYSTRMLQSANAQVAAGGAIWHADVLGMRGQLGRYAVETRRAQAAPRSGLYSTYVVEPTVTHIVTAAVHRNQPARGVTQLDSLRRADPQRGIPVLDRRDPELAIAYAQLGRPDLAAPVLAEFLRALDPVERLVAWARWQLAAGEIALARGQVDSAVAAFHRAADADSGRLEPDWTGRMSAALARAFDKGGRADSAAAYFARLADGGLFQDGALVFPIALRRLGELAEARGDLPEAIRRYRAFAQLWRDADPELQPQVADVRRRIAALEAREARGR
jgi:tetratricopeptide (TPR) repeat protein/tRNA A-37 threonylcarbamoyl transferase component Bud32